MGGLAAYMANLNQTEQDQRKAISSTLSYMRKESLNQSLIDRVLRYYNYVWSRQGGVEEQSIMEELPAPLRQKVASFVNGSDIESIPFFSPCDDSVKGQLLSKLVPKVFLPDDIIMKAGEIGKQDI